jgi:hypothetical protein
MFGPLFVIYYYVLVSSHHCLNVPLFEKIQDYEEEDLEQQLVGSKASVP